MVELQMRFLGCPTIIADGREAKFTRTKSVALIAFLAVSQIPHTRVELSTLLWEDSSQSRGNLRTVIQEINKTLGINCLRVDSQTVQLVQHDQIEVDLHQFCSYLRECTTHGHDKDSVCLNCIAPLEKAVALYRGSLLEGFEVSNSQNFSSWQAAKRDEFERDMCNALSQLVTAYSAASRYEQANAVAHRWINIDPYNEVAHRAIMSAHVWMNNRPAALQHYNTCKQLLSLNLRLAPSRETTDLSNQIREGYTPPTPSFHPASVSAVLPSEMLTPTPSHQASAGTLIGRDNDLNILLSLVNDPSCKLVTVLGSGGVGKTRLVLEALHRLQTSSHFVVHFVSLVHINSEETLIQALSEALGLSLHDQETIPMQFHNFTKELPHKPVLILDGFEACLPYKAILSDILQKSTNLKVVITSREALLISQEWILPILPLTYPSSTAYPANPDNSILDNGVHDGGILDRSILDRSILDRSIAENFSAITLLCTAARRINAAFELTPDEWRGAVRICNLLGGLPLAINYAATWVNTLSFSEIADEIERSMDVLETAAQIEPQQLSLRTIFEGSWKRLSQDEQAILKRLSVFRDGFSRSAVATVGAASLPQLNALINKSVITRDTKQRYRIVEPFRQYIREQITTDEQHGIDESLVVYFANYLAERTSNLKASDQKSALDELQADVNTLRQVWHWMTSHARVSELDKSLETVYLLYQIRGWYAEGKQLFDEAVRAILQIDTEQGRHVLARLLAREAWFCTRLSHYDQSIELLRRSRELVESIACQNDLGFVLYNLAIALFIQGKNDEAEILLHESMHQYQHTQDLHGLAQCLNTLANMTTSDPEKAKQLFQESKTLYESVGDKIGVASCLNGLGKLALFEKEPSKAQVLFEMSLNSYRTVGYTLGCLLALQNMGQVSLTLGKTELSKTYLKEALQLSIQLSIKKRTLFILYDILLLFAHEQQQYIALELASYLSQHAGLAPSVQQQAAQKVSELEQHVTPENFALYVHRGKLNDFDTFQETLFNLL
jgi:DNA-binding SARP family transcriptional activator/predicted ATPase